MKYGQPEDKWNRTSNQHFIDWITSPLKREFGYLEIKKRNAWNHQAIFTTWTGQVLGTGVVINEARSNFGDIRTYIRIRHPETGVVYSGWGPGEGMYTRIKATKLDSIWD